MTERALVLVPVEKLENDIQQALAICGGDPITALRITLIANAFLEKQIEHLSAEVSAGLCPSGAVTSVRRSGARPERKLVLPQNRNLSSPDFDAIVADKPK